jgi:hypothetical protein
MEEKMNERIQEFILQATETTDVYNPDTGITHYREFFDHEKFAKLIVKEYEMLLPEICPWDGPKDSPMKGWHVQFVARKHFGVEE